MGTIFFDFDSTLIDFESLDAVLAFALQNKPNSSIHIKKIQAICDAGMAGEISITESLVQRFSIASFDKKTLAKFLLQAPKIKDQINELMLILKKSEWDIYIISNGFIELISPLARSLYIPPKNFLTNSLKLTSSGLYKFDSKLAPLALGKANAIAKIKSSLKLPIVMVGDSVTDYAVKEKKQADYFIAWQIFIKRDFSKIDPDLTILNLQEVPYKIISFLSSLKN